MCQDYDQIDLAGPNYLRELIPPTVQNTTIYPLRNGSDLIIPFCRLSITTESFIPSTVKLWNRLESIIYLFFVKIGNPVTILAASSCNCSSLVE
jgi:hypothetical protein